VQCMETASVHHVVMRTGTLYEYLAFSGLCAKSICFFFSYDSVAMGIMRVDV
jgi:hypothetical protein